MPPTEDFRSVLSSADMGEIAVSSLIGSIGSTGLGGETSWTLDCGGGGECVRDGCKDWSSID